MSKNTETVTITISGGLGLLDAKGAKRYSAAVARLLRNPVMAGRRVNVTITAPHLPPYTDDGGLFK